MRKSEVRRMVAVLTVATILFAGASCQMLEYKALCYDHTHPVELELLYDWSDCPGAQPEQMSVYVYNLDDPHKAPERYDSDGCARTVFKVPFGNYRLLALNSDTEAILYSDMDSISHFLAYTRESSYSEATMMPSDGTEGSPFILEPDMLWSVPSDSLHLEMMEEHRTITLPMHPRTMEVTIELTDVDNVKYTSELGCTITGMTAMTLVASGRKSDSTAFQAFLAKSSGERRMTGRFVTFGHGADTVRHILTLYAMLEDDTRWTLPIDLTEQMNNPANMRDNSHIHIEITDNIPIPKPIRNGGGLHPTVDGWGDEYIDVSMLGRRQER